MFLDVFGYLSMSLDATGYLLMYWMFLNVFGYLLMSLDFFGCLWMDEVTKHFLFIMSGSSIIFEQNCHISYLKINFFILKILGADQ